MRRIIISGTGSGCGKTTVVCAVLTALKKRGLDVSSFKCGPDYIDTMFHEKAIGTSSYNIDSFFCDDDTLRFLLDENGGKSDISVIEGVMGYYDGNADGRGSAYSVSQITDTKSIIVIDCKGMGASIGAVMKGFLSFREKNNIIGFIFNRLPLSLTETVKNMCAELGTEFLGIMPKSDISFESRHLGLVTADEITDIKSKLSQLGELAEQYIELDRIIRISESCSLEYKKPEISEIFSECKPVIAVAKDDAFCFIYKENINLLEKLGCEIKCFSPLNDEEIPSDADGIILYGGYPELYTERLWENRKFIASIGKYVKNGMPIIAECGGFMYLHTVMENSDGIGCGMADIVRGKAFKTDKLQRFGYITMTAERDNLLAAKGEKITAHEFHYWDSTNCGDAFTARKNNGKEWKCCIADDTMYAGFPHIYFYGNISAAERFVKKCAEYRSNKNGENKTYYRN